MAIPNPVILDDALVQISSDETAANLAELACVANHVELSPDVTITTLDTMCGSVDYPGAVKWALILTLYQSFDPGATEEILSAALESGGPVMFAIAGSKTDPPSATNPVWSGLVIPQPYAPINGDAGDASLVEIEWSVSGQPAKGITMPVGRAGEAKAEKKAA